MRAKKVSRSSRQKKTNTTRVKRRRKKLRSSFERKVKDFLEANNVAFKYEPFQVKYVLEKTYVPDFKLSNGIVIECKGNFTAEDRRKMLAIKRQHPELDVKLLFMRNNKLSKDSKLRYSDWAEKHGFDWHVSEEGSIPMRWMVQQS